MTILEYLRQGSSIEQRIIFLSQRLDSLMETRYGVCGVPLRGDRVQTTKDQTARFTKTLEQIEEMEERIEQEIDLLNALRVQMEGMIRKLLRMEYQLLLIYRYLEGMTWEEIEHLLHVSKATLKNWHKKAISLLEMPENPIFIQKSSHY